jgi:hypothetical protein
MSENKEQNSIEELPAFDRRIVEQWNQTRPTIQELQGQDKEKKDLDELEKINLSNRDLQRRISKEKVEISTTQNIDNSDLDIKPSPVNEPKQVSEKLEDAQPVTASLPAHIAKRYLEVNGKFYFGNKADRLAFVDKGTKLTTSLVDRNIASNLVDIAESRNWTKIEAKGKQEFKREVWLEASLRGIEVKGFKPKEIDYAELKKRGLERPITEPTKITESKTKQAEQTTQSGFEKLVKHGAAPYQNKSENTQSYFATLQDSQGNERTVWGKEIETTLKNANIKTGDNIKLIKSDKTPVTVPTSQFDGQGNKIGVKDIQTFKNNWSVISEEQNKKNQDNAQLIRTKEKDQIIEANPKLTNEVIALHVADRFQAHSGMSKEDGQRFFKQVRETIARKAANGQAQPEIKVQEERQKSMEKEKENPNEER